MSANFAVDLQARCPLLRSCMLISRACSCSDCKNLFTAALGYHVPERIPATSPYQHTRLASRKFVSKTIRTGVSGHDYDRARFRKRLQYAQQQIGRHKAHACAPQRKHLPTNAIAKKRIPRRFTGLRRVSQPGHANKHAGSRRRINASTRLGASRATCAKVAQGCK
jgi:hypothetical protein